ncbi:MAG: replication-associated recombination protein A [Armatimonadetes bacterium]|nr:replication-associated recombination protein A [Armatimonadota bacterium]
MPLAARMRPRDLTEFVGQEHLVGEGTALRRALEEDRVPSLILFGPPGSGKSTLAALVARQTRSHFVNFSAVTSGVADVRRVVAEAAQRLSIDGRKTILFVDEIHRFNKAQQDAFLPHVENGTVTLIGATTENPFFSLNTPLLSRARLYRFEALTTEQVRHVLDRALADPEFGLGGQRFRVDAAALEHLADTANGDCRMALNALDVAAQAARLDGSGERVVDLAAAEEAVQRRSLSYDRDGDNHHDVISAYIKSMRGSDPDAAVYWLARMLEAGEDPRFVARRLVIQAAEDVGNADPQALVLATAAAHAVEYVGMPEAQIPLAQATVYLATAPKSNSAYVAIDRARQDVRERPPAPVPPALRSAAYPGAAQFGHGEGYKYPHDYPAHIVQQEYLPPGAKSQPYYEPSGLGFEAEIQRRMEKLRKVLAAEGRAEEEAQPAGAA